MREFMKVLVSRLSIGVATAIVTAVVIAGGVAYASVANNSVNSAKIIDGSITADDLGPHSVNASEVTDNSMRTQEIRNGTIIAGDLSAGLAGRLTSGLVVIDAGAVSLGAESSLTAQADCPLGLRAIAGGGEETNTSVRAFLVDNHPTVDGLGWVVRYRTDNGDDLTAGDEVTAFVTCAPI